MACGQNGREVPTADHDASRANLDSANDPNYVGACLDPNAFDYDCAGGTGDGPLYVQGPIYVVGNDHFHLDGNGDGIACQ